MVTKDKVKKLVKEIGGADKVREEIFEYTHQAFLIETKKAQLAQKHPDHWVAMHKGQIVAIEQDFDNLLQSIDEKHIPRHEVVVDFLDTNQRCMIL